VMRKQHNWLDKRRHVNMLDEVVRNGIRHGHYVAFGKNGIIGGVGRNAKDVMSRVTKY